MENFHKSFKCFSGLQLFLDFGKELKQKHLEKNSLRFCKHQKDKNVPSAGVVDLASVKDLNLVL